MNCVIEVNNFTKSFDKTKVIDNISFKVQEGSIHGFIGPNGAGKSTTLNSLMGLVIADKGEIFIEGKKVIDDPYFSANIGYIPAEAWFPKNMTVAGFVGCCAYFRGIPLQEAIKKLNMSSSLGPLSKKMCINLSTGQKKILQFFVIDLYNPKIIIMDEPFNGLDPTRRILLSNKIKKSKEEGKTVLLSTHILPDIQELADYITMIKKGKVVYGGVKPSDIKTVYEEHFFDNLSQEKNEANIWI